MAKKGEVKKDIVGQKFKMLTVLDDYIQKQVGNRIRTYWKCQCECGSDPIYVERSVLISHDKISCGCTRTSYKHGYRGKRLYNIWASMKDRCYNINNSKYPIYGGKGIAVCEEWQGVNGFNNFLNWSLENGYEESLTIDRKNSDDDYKPSNCQWLTKSANSAKANMNRHKNKSKLGLLYGLSPTGEYYEFDNISKFAKEHDLKAISIHHCVLGVGFKNNIYKGWKFGKV